jgi:hypothetical protein
MVGISSYSDCMFESIDTAISRIETGIMVLELEGGGSGNRVYCKGNDRCRNTLHESVYTQHTSLTSTRHRTRKAEQDESAVYYMHSH